ncbi:uncharacterized protein BX663DRAFT_538623 [Cokeromyces recurvatus]|uniref:uncharacterized protein n=1 Tax=Cokeromyces recurvatus TaxID=90255 RepID=UPI0022203C1F|nr:uncharacterized protein BX663DRAFT_538623 [Cokeromyces recurvatus]KAI7898269.1 hypothetical protein BX663DRAFT_538623 [Cokeromyces recurvatus]
MVSIYKAIRNNDLELVNYFIDLATGDRSHRVSNLSKQQIQWIQQQYLKNTKYFDLNKRSVKGRTPLHCAVAWNRTEIVKALVCCQQVDINLRDRENGWTALHRSLYIGNVEIARMLLKRDDIDLTIRDWEGLTAFEVYEMTVPHTFPKQQIISKEELSTTITDHSIKPKYIRKGGTDLYSWGHNTNYVLGHPDSENRTKPERVKLQLESQKSPIFMKRPDYLIETVIMSKYHMAILTSDSVDNLLICGFGRGGRLGTGKEVDTQFTPIALQWPERIISAALGRDHTVAVTENGNVITFGSNRYGQLGYEMDNQEQLVPRKIQAQSLKKQPIFGAAASRIHSVVYTKNDIFTFGYNQGQLGYHQPGDDQYQTIPRKISMTTEIVQVVANDNVTAVLNKSHEIILFCNYTQQRLFLPVNRFPNNINVHRSEITYPVKLLGSSTEHLGALTNTGDIFIWSCKLPQTRNNIETKKTNTVIISTPKRIWTRTKSHLAAVDASIGQHNEVILCTISGHVFVGHTEPTGYKFSQIPQLQRCIQVCANSSGAFAAIRSEYVITAIPEVTASTLKYELSTSLPHVRASSTLLDNFKETRIAIDSAKKQIFTSSEDVEEQEILIQKKYNEQWFATVHEAWQQIETVSKKDPTLDVIFDVSGKHIYCHSSILRYRSRIFNQLACCVDKQIEGSMKIKVEKRAIDNRLTIIIHHCQLASILLLLDYIYTDTYQHPMKAFLKCPIFDMPHLESSAQSSFNHKPVPSLKLHLEQLMEAKGDIALESKEGDHLKCHQVILRQRCPFFNNMLRPESVWILDRLKNDKESVTINLDHISTEVLETIIRYIYLDGDGLFDNIERDKEELMMSFLLTLLCEADALLLDRLKLITENALVRFIKLRSASTILEYADIYYAESLKKACLQFITMNLPAFLGSNMLDNLSVQLIRDVENYVRNCQLQAMPTISRISDFNTLYDGVNVEEDLEFSSSLYALSRGDGSATTYDEILITFYPEKSANKKETESVEHLQKKPLSLKLDHNVSKGLHVRTTENKLQPPRRLSVGWLKDTNLEQTSKPSLREIIETENRPTTMGSTNKVQKSSSIIPKKISQKERKRLAYQQELATTSEPSSSKLVWGKVPTVETKPMTKIMAETSLKKNPTDHKGKKIYIQEDLLDEIHEISRDPDESKTNSILFNPIESLGSTFQLTPIRRYTTSAANKNELTHKKSFQTIQKQQELEDSWLKGGHPKKNILQIQKEEQALASIEQYYIQTLDVMSGEWYEIQRVSSKKQ